MKNQKPQIITKNRIKPIFRSNTKGKTLWGFLPPVHLYDRRKGEILEIGGGYRGSYTKIEKG